MRSSSALQSTVRRVMREAYLARSLTVCAAPATLSRISSLTTLLAALVTVSPAFPAMSVTATVALPAASTTLSFRLLSMSW